MTAGTEPTPDELAEYRALGISPQGVHNVVETLDDALDMLTGRTLIPSAVEHQDAMMLVIEFADDMNRMIAGLSEISFPIPGHLRVTLDPLDTTDAVYITETTARRICAALTEALEADRG